MPKHAFKLQRPKSRPTVVRSAILHVVSLAMYAATCTRSWVANSHRRSARHSDRESHAHSGENSRGIVLNVVVNRRGKIG